MNQDTNRPPPPRWIVKLLAWLHPSDTLEEVEGDLAELYAYWYQRDGKHKANICYLWSVLSVLPPFVRRRSKQNSYSQPSSLHPDMLRNYLTIAFRNLIRQKAYSFINIAGLAVGMAVAILIGLWIWDELSYNKYHQNYDHIAQVLQNQTFNGYVGTQEHNPPALGNELRNVYGSDFKHVVMSTGAHPMILASGDKKLVQMGSYSEPEITQLLTLRMLKGTRAGLQAPRSILLSEPVAKAFFGDADPIGQRMKINDDQDVEVTGVYEALPQQSSFHALSFIARWDNNEGDVKEYWDDWDYNSFRTYVQLADQADIDQVSAKIKHIKFNKLSPESRQHKPEMFLHPMSKWHLYSEFENGVNVGGRIEYVWLFGIIGAFVLLLACINFMNLSTARSEKRAKEVGIRKAIGSLRSQLISQFLGESIVVAACAFVLALLLAQLALPLFNQLADKNMAMLWSKPMVWLMGIGFSLLVGVIAGSYPALYLSSFNPVKVLKGTFQTGRLAVIPRKILVVVQFTVSLTLIIGTIIVFRQIQYTKDRPIGYNPDGLVIVQTPTPDVHTHFDAMRDELKQRGAITEMAESHSPLTDLYLALAGFDWKGKDPNQQVSLGVIKVSHEFGKTVGWQFIEGRDFSKDFATDSSAFILNEAAVKMMGLENPVGETVKLDNRPYTVIGVVKDVLMESPYEPVRPSVYRINGNKGNFAVFKLNPAAGAREALSKIETTFKKYAPAASFDYSFVDEEYALKFRAEERIGKLASVFASLAIFISCLGLFGLASFMAEQRTKEISIRKVLGASVSTIWLLLSKDFVRLVILSCLIAAPIAWYFLNNWLQNYKYRTSISPWVFVLSGAAALLITLLTVSFQAIKVALINPVKSLRNE